MGEEIELVDASKAEEGKYVFTPDYKEGRVKDGQIFLSSGKVTVNGQEIAYHTDAEDFIFVNDAGEEEASIFAISQFKDGGTSSRPVLFVVNGGPGMTMADMYATMYGPRRLKTGNVNEVKITAPYEIVDNDNWLLDVCDIVLIDPVGCGYGRLIDGSKAYKYYSVEGDAEAISKFIKFWVTKYHRWNSPKYLNGVSFGGTRCATIPQFLMGGAMSAAQKVDGITLNGVIPMSDCMSFDFVSMKMDPEDNPNMVMTLPGCAATNWYHNREGKPAMDEFIAEAETWGFEVLKPFLLDLDNKSDEEKAAVAEKLSYYIGLAPEMILSMNFRYEAYGYTNMLLAEKGLACGQYDSRFTTMAGGIASPTFDPIYDDAYLARFWPATTAVAMHLYSEELGIDFGDSREFVCCNFTCNYGMNWNTTNGVSVFDIHMGNMRHNPAMRTLMTAGKFDFCFPIGNARWQYKKMVENGFGDRTTYLELESGHEAYYTDDSRKVLTDTIRKFVTEK